MRSKAAWVASGKASGVRSTNARRSQWLRTATFFQKGDVGGETANFGVEFLDLALVGGFRISKAIAALE